MTVRAGEMETDCAASVMLAGMTRVCWEHPAAIGARQVDGVLGEGLRTNLFVA